MLVFVEKIGEIFHTVSNNKLRVFLTGFAVSWGLFMLIVLLGTGYGLENGVRKSFAKDAINSMRIYSGQTSLPYKGLRLGRLVQFQNEDTTVIKRDIDKVDRLSGTFHLLGVTTHVDRRSANFEVVGIHPDYQDIENLHMKTGRFLNLPDYEKKRKVAVIGKTVQSEFFPNEPAIGQYISIKTIPFLVVGVFEDPGDDRQEETIFLPVSTLQAVFSGDDRIHTIALTIDEADVAQSQATQKKLVGLLAARHEFDTADERAVFVHNTFQSYAKYMSLFKNIRFFIWIIGIGSIVAGIVGISNIMLITVRERTREIGIRKAFGATPGSILEMIITEAILTTLVFGYIGLLAGIVVLQVASHLLTNVEYFYHPEVNLWVAFGALLLLVVCGMLAGVVPARRASLIMPVEALREE